MPKVIAIDQGTSSSRAMVFDERGQPLTTSQKELTLHYPHSGWVEQNPEDIWNDTLAVLRDVHKKHPDAQAIGITNQRETTIIWDRRTGQPLYNAIVWQDRRTADYCGALRKAGHEKIIRERTGLLLDPYFSATKIRWILDNTPGAWEDAQAGHLAFGTIDSFLLWRLTGGQVHATDATNASRTMLFNIHSLQWDRELLAIFGIPESLLPVVKENASSFGYTASGIIPKSLPITGMAGDQQAALVGQACFKEGMIKSTYGTGCFALMNIGPQVKLSTHKLLTSLGYWVGQERAYVLEGSIFVAGAAIQWLRDEMKFIKASGDTDKLAHKVKDNGGVYFIPAFTGLGAPYWNPNVRGAIFGLTRGTTKAHIVRAALEAQAYQTRDLLSAFQQDSGLNLTTMRVDGGLISNEFMVQFLADVMKMDVEQPTCSETTALGAAYLAMLGAGVFRSLNDITANWDCQKKYQAMTSQDKFYKEWKNYIARLI